MDATLGRYQRCENQSLGEILDEAFASGQGKAETGTIRGNGIWYGLIGHYICQQDEAGFFTYESYGEAKLAEAKFASIEAELKLSLSYEGEFEWDSCAGTLKHGLA